MTTSEQINDIATALAGAQSEIQNVTKDAKNPHFKSDYATLDAITDMVRPAFAKHGLAVVQIPTYAEGVVTVQTLVTHSSGQWIKGETSSPISKADPQGIGSACTYLRRYSLAAIAALAQTDDDGNASSNKGNGAVAEQAPKAPAGYDDWLNTLASVADNGAEELKAMWFGSSLDYRRHLTETSPKTWDDLKAKAAKKVPVSA
ncbi:MAG TPA: ERF family protein [Gemmatimonadaceae bacterium]|nr:ERF family protein [Gemmatimonadaceae bacterium]